MSEQLFAAWSHILEFSISESVSVLPPADGKECRAGDAAFKRLPYRRP